MLWNLTVSIIGSIVATVLVLQATRLRRGIADKENDRRRELAKIHIVAYARGDHRGALSRAMFIVGNTLTWPPIVLAFTIGGSAGIFLLIDCCIKVAAALEYDLLPKPSGFIIPWYVTVTLTALWLWGFLNSVRLYFGELRTFKRLLVHHAAQLNFDRHVSQIESVLTTAEVREVNKMRHSIDSPEAAFSYIDRLVELGSSRGMSTDADDFIEVPLPDVV